VLFNIGHGADMAETGSGFSASHHNKAGANRNLRGGRFARGGCGTLVAKISDSRRREEKKEVVQWRVGCSGVLVAAGCMKKEKIAKN